MNKAKDSKRPKVGFMYGKELKNYNRKVAIKKKRKQIISFAVLLFSLLALIIALI